MMDPVGVLLTDKPEGPTSHDIVSLVRRAAGIRRVGHTGTLDPFASGLLLLCLGWTTRLSEYLTGLPKAYRGVIRLGERTDTDDRTGTVVARDEAWRDVDSGQLREALSRQVGEVEQYPPAYSAKKVGGRRAYAVARGGSVPALAPVRVTISRLAVSDFSPPDVTVEIECSSGTYIRAVARDVGEALGVGAHLRALRRLRIGDFSVDDALKLDRQPRREEIVGNLRAPAAALAHLPKVEVGAEAAIALRQGRPIEWPAVAGERPVAVLVDGHLVAVSEARADKLWPRKVFGE
jgi:tRNA pseudouridine55 synthase